MKDTLLPCTDSWFFVGKGTRNEAIIYRVALWSQSEDGITTGLIGEIGFKDGSPSLIGPPPGCDECGYYPAEALTTEAIDTSYR